MAFFLSNVFREIERDSLWNQCRDLKQEWLKDCNETFISRWMKLVAQTEFKGGFEATAKQFVCSQLFIIKKQIEHDPTLDPILFLLKSIEALSVVDMQTWTDEAQKKYAPTFQKCSQQHLLTSYFEQLRFLLLETMNNQLKECFLNTFPQK